MAFWLLLLLFVATTVVGALLAPHPRGPQPSALGDFSVPTASEGRAIPVVFGTCMIKGGNTVWWGDLKSKPIKVGGGILTFGKTQITGYKYYLGCQFMLCHGPVDALVDIQADVKSVPRSTATINNGNGSENYIQVTATGDVLFGGTTPGGGGGISGIINFYRGLDTQQPDDYLSAKQGRIVTDQSGIGYTFHGTGNGGITALSAGPNSLEETFTITAVGIDGNPLHSTYQKMRFSIVGSLSGAQFNSSPNAEGSTALWADQAFSSSRLNLTVLTGSTQYINGDVFTIVTQHSHIAPAYRRLCYAVFKQLYVGTSSYLKPLAFVVRRCPDPLSQGAGIANIGGDANPALAVYELLTNIDYGLGIPTARIDPSSFSSAAATLATEGLGISMQFDVQASADQLIGEILRHCDGLIYTDPNTGLWMIVLARGGYDPTTLPTLTVDNVLATPDFSRGSWSETTNMVTIKFLSRSNNFNTRVVRAYDAANISVTTEVRSQSIEFNGISSEAAAALVAIRVLKTLTYPLAKIKIVCNRTAWQFRPGGLFRLTWVPLGVINQVFRIIRIGYGELTDGKISIDAVEDIFGINSVSFVPPPSSGWVNPAGAPIPDTADLLIEAPAEILDSTGVGLGIYGMAMGARASAIAVKSFQAWLDEGSGYSEGNDSIPVCPLGYLSAKYKAGTLANDPTGFTLTAASIDLVVLSSISAADLVNATNLLLIDGEIMAWQTITHNADDTYTVTGILRGLFDTVPADHALGAKVWFFSEGFGMANPVAFPFDLTLAAKFLPQNSAGVLPIASASPLSLTTHSRYHCPYPPGNLRIQAQPYGTRYTTITGDLTITWSSRSSGDVGIRPVILQDAGDRPAPTIGVEARSLINGSAVGTNVDFPAGSPETITITAALRATYPGAPDAPLTVQLWSWVTTIGTLWSLQAQSVSVIFTGFGMTFGEYFGGITA